MATESKETIGGLKSNTLIIGPHVNKELVSPKEGITEHIKAAIKNANDQGINVGAIQIFIANPRTGKPTLEPDTADYKSLKAYVQSHPEIQFFIHSPYTTTALWKGSEYAAFTMRSELRICDDIGFRGVVIHLDSHGVDDVIKYLPKIVPKLPKDPTNTLAKIYVETPHVKSNLSHYETPEKIAKLFSAIREHIDPDLSRIAYMLDTAHLHSCGVDLSNSENAAKWIKGMELIQKILPPENIGIHLNGSVYERGNGNDKHECLMAIDDKIWGMYKREDYNKSGLSQFISYAKENHIPVILERREYSLYKHDYELLYEHEPSIRMSNKSIN